MENIRTLAGKVRRPFVYNCMSPELAYVVGAYVGDGRVDNTRYWFQITSIDRDFVEEVKRCTDTYLSPQTRDIKTVFWKCSKGKPTFIYRVHSLDYCNWLIKFTNNNQLSELPDDIKLNLPCLKAFLEGFLDAEGYVCMNKHTFDSGRHCFSLGFAGTNIEFVDNISKYFAKFNVIVSGRHISQQKKCWKPIVSYRINLKSFIKANFRFHIKRKQDRIELYKVEQGLMTPTETVCQPPLKKGDETVQSISRDIENNRNIIPPIS
jgi:intein-encoded DNA endonuclease-like protein